MRKVFLSLIIAALSGFCFAPVELHERPSNGYRPNAATEQDLQREQQHQRVMGQVGGVPQVEGGAPEVNGSTSQSGAAILGAAETNAANRSTADQVMRKAEDRRKEEEGSSWLKTLMMGVLALGAGFGIIQGFKAWAAKHVPEPRNANYDW